MVVAHRLVPGGIGVELGAVEGHAPEADEPGPGAQLKHLDEQVLEGGKMAAAEAADRAVVGRLVGRRPPERHVDQAAPLELATRDDARRVGEHESLSIIRG